MLRIGRPSTLPGITQGLSAIRGILFRTRTARGESDTFLGPVFVSGRRICSFPNSVW